MSMTQEYEKELQRKQREEQILIAKNAVAEKEALTRLESNKDFQLLFTKGLFQDHAINCVKGRGGMLGIDAYARTRDNVQVDIDMIGALDSYLEAIKAYGSQQQETLNYFEQAEVEANE